MSECCNIEFSRLATVFQAISDETRQRILLLLEEKERCVNDLVAEFDLSQPSISRHLAILKHAGLVNARREGQQVYYSINSDRVRSCCKDFFCCFEACACFFEDEAGEEK
jgi:ArsR family transcriptional regulator